MNEFQPNYFLGSEKPQVAQRLEITKDIFWIRMPMPFALDHINLWHLPDAAHATIVDSGIHYAPIVDAWQILFQDPQMQSVQNIVATHFHPDHVGLAQTLLEHFDGARFHMSLSEYTMARLVHGKAEGFNARAENRLFQRHGLIDPQIIASWEARDDYYNNLVHRLPPHFSRLRAGMNLRLGAIEWQTLTGYGHSPEHIALFSPAHKILIAGDMILPRISTNVAVHAYAPDANPLAEFLQSIDAFRALPDDTLILPSHGLPFYGLHGRIAQLEAHHQAHLETITELARHGALTAFGILPALFKRPLTDTHNLFFALGEAVAHLNFLWHKGTLQREFDGTSYHFFAQK